MNGFFNLPAPLFGVLDDAMASALPSGLRIALWAVAASLLSMGIYWLLSPQGRIAQAKTDALQARRALEAHDGDLSEAGPLIRAQFAAVFRQIGSVLPATLVAVIPVICILAWADARFAYTLPNGNEAGAAPAITVTPPRYDAAWSFETVPPRILVNTPAQADALEIRMVHPVPLIEKRHWWNTLFGNPLGYLPDDGEVERVEMQLPSQRHQPFGPDWLGSWLAIFLPVMVLTSLTVLRVGRIH